MQGSSGEFDWDFEWASGNKILDGDDDQGELWVAEQGFILNVESMEKYNIGAVVSAIKCTLPQTLRERVKHLIVPLLDSRNQPIMQCFDKVFQFIELHRKTTNVVVNCFAGVSRSVALATSYIMRKYDYGFETSLAIVKAKRSCANPNSGFLNQLRRYGQELQKKKNPGQSNTQQEVKKEPIQQQEQATQLTSLPASIDLDVYNPFKF